MDTETVLGTIWSVGTLVFLCVGAAISRERSLESALDLSARAVLWPVVVWMALVRGIVR